MNASCYRKLLSTSSRNSLCALDSVKLRLNIYYQFIKIKNELHKYNEYWVVQMYSQLNNKMFSLQNHKMHYLLFTCKKYIIWTNNYNKDLELAQKTLTSSKTLTLSSIRNLIQACQVHKYHLTHHPCKFRKV